MRDIKFRAWINNSKKFEAIEFIGTGQKTFPIYTKDNKYWFPMQGVLEQYTGLKDKNGVDVYEGDVLWTGVDYVYISFKSGAFVVISGIEDEMALSEYPIDEWTISGNIHENVDILVDDIERMIPDDIGNDIHEFLHGGDK